MNVDKSKIGNMLVNIGAVVLLLGGIYLAVAYVIIPLSKLIWLIVVSSAKEGYQQLLTLSEAFMHWDMAMVLVLGLAVYLVPSIIAIKRKHPNKLAIVVTNVLFGWSVIGWILALIWSLPSAEARLR